MRPGQPNQQHHNNNNKNRMRNRNRKGPNPLTRSYESNGGDVKIRGTALHVAEKYVQLARDAQSSGDRVAGENYLQHAEHYYRIVAAAQAQMPQPQQIYRNEEGEYDEDPGDSQNPMGGQNATGGGYRDNAYQGNRQPDNGYQGNRQQTGGGQSYGAPEQQPQVNGNGTVMTPNVANNEPMQEQPAFDNGYPQADVRSDEGGGQPVANGNPNQGTQGERGPGGGQYRQRRRRPYRDNYNNNERGQQGAQGNPAAGPDPLDSGGDSSGDD